MHTLLVTRATGAALHGDTQHSFGSACLLSANGVHFCALHIAGGCATSAGKKHNKQCMQTGAHCPTQHRTRDVLLELDILLSCSPCVFMLQRTPQHQFRHAALLVNVRKASMDHAFPGTFGLPGRPSPVETKSPCR